MIPLYDDLYTIIRPSSVVDIKRKMATGVSVTCGKLPLAIHIIYFSISLTSDDYTRFSIHKHYECK